MKMNGRTKPRASWLRAVGLLTAILAVAPFAAGAAAPPKAGRALVPAQFAPKADSLGFNWDIDPMGSIQDGTDDCFDSGAMLMVNGQRSQSGQPMMTPDGSEYVLTSRQGNLEVTRWIKVDAKAAAARYVESVKNNGAATASVSLVVSSPLGSSCQTWVSDTGAPTPASLGPKETGVLAIQRQGTSRPSVVFCVAGPTSKVKPTVSVQHQTVFQFTYNLSVPAGRTVSVLHAVAQRRINAQPDPKALASMFKPLCSRQFIRDVAPDLRRTIVNIGGFGSGGGEGGPELLTTLAKLGVARGNTDILAVGEETRVRGTVACEGLTLSTRFGALTLPLAKIAALTGGRYAGRRSQVFLRDGQVFTGKLEAPGLRFTMATGINVELKVETLDRLALRAADADGKPAPEAGLFVETFDGDRLAVARSDDLKLSATTPWGTVDIPLDELKWISVPEEGQPGHLVRLKDGNRFFALLDGPPLALKTLAFGVQSLRPAEMRSLVAVDYKGEEGEETEITQPYVTLVGENLLVGRLDLPAINLVASGQVIPVPPGQIRTLTNTAEEEGGGGGTPAFRADLWGGGTVIGRLREPLIPIRVGDRLCRVPARDIVSVSVPAPAVPEGTRDKIAQLIRDLGNPEWEKRDAASRQLAELGQVAKAQLAEAVKQSTDPEVRRRAQALLDEIGE